MLLLTLCGLLFVAVLAVLGENFERNEEDFQVSPLRRKAQAVATATAVSGLRGGYGGLGGCGGRPPLTFQFCGGIAGIPCPSAFVCVDDPRDDCNPLTGGADCGGICIPRVRSGGLNGGIYGIY